jgi:hypothetical protein
MEKNLTLFGENDIPPKSPKALKWRLVTNQRNLLYMLAAGLVMSAKGFGGKYYLDTLSSFPGWLPLFADNVPQAAIDLSVSERRHLRPCIATIDLKTLHGLIFVIENDGAVHKIQFPDELTGSEAALLVPAPLPITWIESIAFTSKDDKSNCEADARDFGNVPLKDFKRDVVAPLFAKANKSPWPPSGVNLPNRDCALDKSFAVGGIMAMLLHMGNLGDLGMHACRLGFDPAVTDGSLISDPMIREIGEWMNTGAISPSTDVLPKLFWGVVDRVTARRFTDDVMSPRDVVLEYLETAEQELDEKMKSALAKLTIDLRKLIGFADSTITELFEQHSKPFSRVMTLFFLRDNCTEITEFRHPLLTEGDYVGAAILFAARDGWLGLPLVLRDVEGLQAAVSHRMAALTHRMDGADIDLGKPPDRPMPLRELFIPGEKGWSVKQREAALLLARESKWFECIQTRITLGKGEYHVVIDGNGVQIVLPGDVKAVVTEVKPETFFSLFGETAISPKAEKKVRDLLKA